MHELSVAQALIKSVLREVTDRGLGHVNKIVVRVGSWSGIMAEALLFGFETVRLGTPLGETVLEIEAVFAQAHCQSCGHIFSLEKPVFFCPRCGSEQLSVSGGDDLHIAYLEVENSHA